MTLEILYIFQALFLLWLSWQDYRTLQVPLWGLLGFTLMTVGGLLWLHHPVFMTQTLIVLGLLGFIKMAYWMALKKNILGSGDLVLLVPLLIAVDLTELPLFLVLAGLGGIVTLKILRKRQAPFIPALSFAYLSVVIIRYL